MQEQKNNEGILTNPYLWAVIYVIAVLVANYTATMFIELPIFGFIAIGTFVFGITFTARDYVHRAGRPLIYGMILVAAILATLMSFLLDVPIRIIIASFIAIIIAETADTEVYQRFIEDRWLTRVLKSNLVSIPLDTVLFTLIAFLGVAGMPPLEEIIFAETLFKFIVGFLTALLRFIR